MNHSLIRNGGNTVLKSLHTTLGLEMPLPELHIRNILRALRALEGKRVAVIAGGMADADSVGSAYALSKILGNRAIMAVTTPTNPVEKLLAQLEVVSVPLLRDLDPADFSYAVVVDTSSSFLVPGISQAWQDKLALVIDHHMQDARSDLTGRAYTLIDPNIPATSSIIALALPDQLITPPIAIALATGLIVDSGNMARGGTSTNLVSAYLTEKSGLRPHDIQQIGFGELDPVVRSQILGYFGANPSIVAGRLVADFTIGLTQGDLRHYAAIAAEFMTGSAGATFSPADVAMCAIHLEESPERRVTRFSLRVATEVANVDLSQIAFEIGRRFNGNGGGHRRQAGGFVPFGTDLAAVFESFRSLVEAQFAVRKK